MRIYLIAYMVKTIIFYHPINHIHHPHLSLLTLCGKRVKQSQTVRGGRFESNLLTLQGRPKHTSRGYSQSHTCNISPFFPGCGSGSPSSTTEYDDSAPACARMRKRRSKKVKVKSTCRSNQVLKLTDYHILGMCLVRSNA